MKPIIASIVFILTLLLSISKPVKHIRHYREYSDDQFNTTRLEYSKWQENKCNINKKILDSINNDN